MKRLMTLGLAIPATLLLAACGGAASSSGGSTPASSNANTKTVTVRQLSGVGSVLVDHSGAALYTSNLEGGGKIVCDGACNSFWKPLTLSGGKPTAAAAAGKLGVVRRPDGSAQVTVNGKPLYTFAEDSPGKATGDGFTDDFNGHHFTWSVVHAGGTTTGGPGQGGSASPPSSNSGSGGSYGY